MILEEDYKGLKSEITASMCLMPVNEKEIMYNEGLKKALHFIEKYHKGEGLFQENSGDKQVSIPIIDD